MTTLPILYSFRRCPYAMRARLAIAASAQQCELREVVLRNKPQALIQASPKATVPVLVLPDGRVLEQSLDIMLWALQQADPQKWLTPPQGSLEAMLRLIKQCDEHFKPSLDRYKYPQRFAHEASADDPADSQQMAIAHRTQGAQWLSRLDEQLQSHGYLFGDRPSLADMAIAPFVRQFAHVDIDWFRSHNGSALSAWLQEWMESELFAAVMTKYEPWASGERGVVFP